MEDTICAISTAPGVGAISIIRMSGKDSIKILKKVFKGSDLSQIKTHTIHYGFIYDGKNRVDEVLVSIMLSPKTYTTEDIVEINSHGGLSTTNKILELLLENGARLSSPGEFTKRAFINGRIDLVEAESVNDLIIAKTDAQRELALNNMRGLLTNKINDIRKKIIDIMSNIEVNIDYPEYEDIEVVTHETLLPKLKNIDTDIIKMLNDSKNGKIIKEGINIAIVGKPNVGKSSILNTLLEEQKAIVTNIPGTTRDIVEGSLVIEGFLFNFLDTAGIRKTKDVVEKIGVEKSIESINKADIVIIVLNNNELFSIEDKELIDSIDDDKRIIFVNKSDLDNKLDLNYNHILGNTLDSNGLDNLKNEIVKKASIDKINNKDMTYMSNVRQIDLLKKASKSIKNAISSLENNTPIDIVEIDITSAFNYLGEITGDSYKDELIDNLFKNFCLGK